MIFFTVDGLFSFVHETRNYWKTSNNDYKRKDEALMKILNMFIYTSKAKKDFQNFNTNSVGSDKCRKIQWHFQKKNKIIQKSWQNFLYLLINASLSKATICAKICVLATFLSREMGTNRTKTWKFGLNLHLNVFLETSLFGSLPPDLPASQLNRIYRGR